MDLGLNLWYHLVLFFAVLSTRPHLPISPLLLLVELSKNKIYEREIKILFFTQTEPNVFESWHVSHYYVIVLSLGATIVGVLQFFGAGGFGLDCLLDQFQNF